MNATRQQRTATGHVAAGIRVVVAFLAIAGIPALVAAQVESPDVDALAREAFELLNDARINEGLEPLQWSDSLALIAARQSSEQANRGRVSHHSAEFGLSTERRVRISYPDVPRLAENVGRNRTVQRLHEALLRSPGHRRNRLDEDFTNVGIGIAWDGNYALYLTEVFVTAPGGGPLGPATTFYFDAPPDAYEARDNPRVEEGRHTIVIGAPGADDPEYWTGLGIDAYNRGDLSAAESSFRKALELKSDYHYARYNLARVLIAAGEPAAAAELLDQLIELDPGDLDAIATRGTAALFLEDYEGAAELFRRVLRERREDAGAWYNLGLSLEYLDRSEDAASAYREALRIDPGLHAAQVGLARVLRR